MRASFSKAGDRGVTGREGPQTSAEFKAPSGPCLLSAVQRPSDLSDADGSLVIGPDVARTKCFSDHGKTLLDALDTRPRM